MMNLIDLHCDTLMDCFKGTPLAKNDLHIDIEKLKAGGCLAQFFAIFIPTFDDAKRSGIELSPYEYFNETAKAFEREMELNKSDIAPARCYADIVRNRECGKMSGILTIEDGVPVDGKLERIDEFYDKGVRLITLTWNYENSLGFPNSGEPELMALGLKPFGIEAVRHMNELGIIIDVSHLSDGGFYDVAKYSTKPFVASHSCARALSDRTRNLTDDMLQKLGNAGGIVGVNFCAGFLNKGADYTDIESIVRHLAYMGKKAGIEALALGSDFDGIGSELEFKNYAGMPKIVDALKAQFTPSEIDKITHGNALRLIRETIG